MAWQPAAGHWPADDCAREYPMQCAVEARAWPSLRTESARLLPAEVRWGWRQKLAALEAGGRRTRRAHDRLRSMCCRVLDLLLDRRSPLLRGSRSSALRRVPAPPCRRARRPALGSCEANPRGPRGCAPLAARSRTALAAAAAAASCAARGHWLPAAASGKRKNAGVRTAKRAGRRFGAPQRTAQRRRRGSPTSLKAAGAES